MEGYKLEESLDINKQDEERIVEWDHKGQVIQVKSSNLWRVTFALPSPDLDKMVVIFRENKTPIYNGEIKHLVVYNADGSEHCSPMLPMTKSSPKNWPYLSPRRAAGCGPILWWEDNGKMRMYITLDMGCNDAVEDREFFPASGEYGEAGAAYKWC